MDPGSEPGWIICRRLEASFSDGSDLSLVTSLHIQFLSVRKVQMCFDESSISQRSTHLLLKIHMSSLCQIVIWALAIVPVPTPSRSWRCRSSPPTSVADLPSSSSTWVHRPGCVLTCCCGRLSLWTASLLVSSGLKSRQTKSQIPLPDFQLPSSNLAVLKLATDDECCWL